MAETKMETEMEAETWKGLPKPKTTYYTNFSKEARVILLCLRVCFQVLKVCLALYGWLASYSLPVS